MFTHAVFEILLFKSRLILRPTQRVTRREVVKFSVENQKIFGFCWNHLKDDYLTNLRVFEWFLFIFLSFLSPSLKAMFTLTVFEILLVKGRSLFCPVKQVTESETVRSYFKAAIKRKKC